MNPGRFFSISAVVLLICAVTASAQPRRLIWSDEFDGAAGTAPNPAKWDYDTGIGWNGWGNNELEYYTSRTENAYLDGAGHLIIKAIRETYTGADGITRDYTSARLVTRGKFEPLYGRIEARMKLPFGQGIWPAFWMLGTDLGTTGWPGCGEVDIMENIGREPAINHGSVHGPGYSGNTPMTALFTLLNGQRFADDFHVFAIEWNTRSIRFYVDSQLYQTRRPGDLPAGTKWVFDHPFYLLLNVAVGGNWPGSPDATTIFPQMMTVDYVRVYEAENVSSPPPRRTPPRRIGK